MKRILGRIALLGNGPFLRDFIIVCAGMDHVAAEHFVDMVTFVYGPTVGGAAEEIATTTEFGVPSTEDNGLTRLVLVINKDASAVFDDEVLLPRLDLLVLEDLQRAPIVTRQVDYESEAFFAWEDQPNIKDSHRQTFQCWLDYQRTPAQRSRSVAFAWQLLRCLADRSYRGIKEGELLPLPNPNPVPVGWYEQLRLLLTPPDSDVQFTAELISDRAGYRIPIVIPRRPETWWDDPLMVVLLRLAALATITDLLIPEEHRVSRDELMDRYDGRSEPVPADLRGGTRTSGVIRRVTRRVLLIDDHSNTHQGTDCQSVRYTLESLAGEDPRLERANRSYWKRWRTNEEIDFLMRPSQYEAWQHAFARGEAFDIPEKHLVRFAPDGRPHNRVWIGQSVPCRHGRIPELSHGRDNRSRTTELVGRSAVDQLAQLLELPT